MRRSRVRPVMGCGASAGGAARVLQPVSKDGPEQEVTSASNA